MPARPERSGAWRAAGLLASVLVLAAVVAAGEGPVPLALLAACVQAGGAGLIALAWPEHREARFLTFCLLCLAIWAAWTGIAASLAISTALALFLGFLHLAAPPATTARRWFTFAAFAFDTVAAAFTFLPPPDAWRGAILLALNLSVIACGWLAAMQSGEQRRLVLPVVVPVVALCATMGLEDAATLANLPSTATAAIALASTAIGLTVPLGFIAGLLSLPEVA